MGFIQVTAGVDAGTSLPVVVIELLAMNRTCETTGSLTAATETLGQFDLAAASQSTLWPGEIGTGDSPDPA
jgi:hypothetical protein